MRKLILILVAAMAIAVSASSAQAVPSLFEWVFNIDSTISDSLAGDPFPGSVNAAGFNATTGLGTLTVTIGSTGVHSVIAFLDHEIDQTLNGFSNEFGAVIGAPAAGLSWEIDEPGFVFGDIYANVLAGALDNTNGVPAGSPDDVSMALGWNFALAAGETAVINLLASLTAPVGGFYLAQTDPDSNQTVYYSTGLTVTGGEVPLPVPGTLVLTLTGLAGLISARGWSLRRRG